MKKEPTDSTQSKTSNQSMTTNTNQKDSPLEFGTPDVIKQRPKAASQDKKATEPVTSVTPKETVTNLSYANHSSTYHSRQVSQNDSGMNPILER